MSWWVRLVNRNTQTVVTVPTHNEGGVLVGGGNNLAEINVTYNYGKFFDFRSLTNIPAEQTLVILAKAVAQLGTERDPDYWKPTEGNAGYICRILLRWALEHPMAVWEVH